MKKLLLLSTVLGILVLGFSAKAQFFGELDDHKTKPIREVVERMFVGENGQAITPNMKIFEVVAAVKWKILSEIPDKDVRLVRENIASDNGPVAYVLFRSGYNYQVLKFLRLLVNHDPTDSNYGIIDIPTLMGTITGNSRAGLAAFERLSTGEWQANMVGTIELNFDADIYWVLDRTRAMADEAIKAAGSSGYSFLDFWRNNRYQQAEAIIDFANRVEAVMTQFQGFLTSIQVKANQNQNNERVHKELIALKNKLLGDKTKFVNEISSVLNAAQINGPDRTPWKSVADAILKTKISIRELEKRYRDIAHENIVAIDRITGTNKVDNKYADDTPVELDNSRQEQTKANDTLTKKWNGISTKSYFKRYDKWIYEHWHAEGQYADYSLQSSEKRQKEVQFTFIAPILEEQYIVLMLKDAMERLTVGRPNHDQILEIRSDLQKALEQHRAYMAGGPRKLDADAPEGLRDGYEDHFRQRNQLIQDWFALAIESSHRQEAHEKLGYLGIAYSSDLRGKYEKILDFLKAKKESFRKTKIWGFSVTGAAAAAGACYFFLTSGSAGF